VLRSIILASQRTPERRTRLKAEKLDDLLLDAMVKARKK